MEGVSSEVGSVLDEGGTCVGMVGSGTGIGVSLDEVSPDGVSSTGMKLEAAEVAAMEREEVLPTAVLALLIPS